QPAEQRQRPVLARRPDLLLDLAQAGLQLAQPLLGLVALPGRLLALALDRVALGLGRLPGLEQLLALGAGLAQALVRLVPRLHGRAQLVLRLLQRAPQALALGALVGRLLGRR